MDDDAIEAAVRGHLDALGARYEVVRIDPAYAETAAFCERYGFAMEDSANCIVVRSKGADPRFAACAVQATRRLDVNRTVKRLLGVRKASFAATEEAQERTGMRQGGVTPFGLPDDVPLYVDARILDRDRVVVGGGSRSLKVVLDPEVFTRLPGAEIIPGLSIGE